MSLYQILILKQNNSASVRRVSGKGSLAVGTDTATEYQRTTHRRKTGKKMTARKRLRHSPEMAVSDRSNISSETKAAVQLLLGVGEAYLQRELKEKPHDDEHEEGSPISSCRSASESEQSIVQEEKEHCNMNERSRHAERRALVLSTVTSNDEGQSDEGTEDAPKAMKIGSKEKFPVKYNRAQRRAALQRYRDKKKRRSQNRRNVIRYDIRKKLADRRPRYKGRFSKPPPGDKEGANSVELISE